MSSLLLEPTSTAQWQSLVKEAEAKCHTQLDEELESYLVFLLMRFLSRPEMATKIMALEFLRSMQTTGKLRQEHLRDVGDQCLLVSGLFPQRAESRLVKISYFVNLGRTAYMELSAQASAVIAQFYRSIADGFVPLMDVLHAVRELGTERPVLSSLEAIELWQDTGSQHALANLRAHTKATPGPGSRSRH